MYIKNFDFYPLTHHEYAGLKVDGKYLLPHLFKYIAWFLVAAVVISSSVVLILYGISFGTVKSYLWITGFLTSFFISILITAPIRILIVSLINSVCLKRQPVLLKRRIHSLLLANPAHPDKKKQIKRIRQSNASLYCPTPLHKLQERLDDIKYNLELRNLLFNILVYLIFLFATFYATLYNKTPLTFHSNDVIFDVILSGNYMDSVQLKKIKTYEMFIKYVNETLLPALLPEKNSSKSHKRRRWHSKPVPEHVRKRDIGDDAGNSGGKYIFDRGWTINPNLKLLGKPRFRQVRVKTDSCKELTDLEGRNLECALDLSLFNLETRDFSLNWASNGGESLTKMQAAPWLYRSPWESATFPIFAKFSTYPAGGYILEFARQIDDARLILEFLDSFQWVDFRTRAIFIEFTLYCVNTNLFSVVTVIAERPANGYIIPSYQIDTCRFVFLDSDKEFLGLTATVLFSFLVFFFLFRESFKIHRVSLKFFIRRTYAVLDVIVLLLGVLSMIFTILRSIYVNKLLKRLEKENNSEFVSFIYAATWHVWSIYTEAFVVCLATFKLFRLLTFQVVFFQVQNTLHECYRRFTDLTFQLIILILAFAFFFNMTLARYYEGFSTFGAALSTMIGRAASVDDNFDFSVFVVSTWYIAPIFFTLFVVLVSITFVNIFIAVICLYFKKVREISFMNRYNLFEFIKHFFTLKRQKDILRLKRYDKPDVKNKQPSVIRLKGGGNTIGLRSRKKWKKHSEVKELKEESKELGQVLRTKLKDFVVKRPFDTTDYRDLAVERESALKNLMILFLTSDCELRKTFSASSLMALFCSLTKVGRDSNQMAGDYFIVESKSKVEVFKKSLFSRMKKVVEDIGREGDVLEEEDARDKEAIKCEEKLRELDKKLCLLLQKHRCKERHRKSDAV